MSRTLLAVAAAVVGWLLLSGSGSASAPKARVDRSGPGPSNRTTSGGAIGAPYPGERREIDVPGDNPDLVVGPGLPGQGVVAPSTGTSTDEMTDDQQETLNWAQRVAGFR